MTCGRGAGAAALLLVAAAFFAAAAAAQPITPAPAGAKVLRYGFPVAETGFDVGMIQDLYSAIIVAHIFDAPYRYDHLARPAKIRPNTAAAMPEVSADFRTWTIRVKPGTYFADDPVFQGKKRELVAQDYVYSIKRIFDPANKSPRYSGFAEEQIVGIEALREAALKGKKPFDYDREVEGLKALDRYTLQIKLEKPRPRFLYRLAQSSIAGAAAREVIEGYPGKSMEHPVGTGPFRLAGWRRSSKIVLEKNPNFREMVYDEEPAADDAEGQALLGRFKGRRLPMIDRVEISVIEASQPRWLAFLNREFDYIAVPGEFVNQAAPKGKLAPNLARRGVQLYQSLVPDRVMYYFNMEHPLVGGYTPEKVALRRAISLSTNIEREIRTIRRGQAIPAQSIVAPGTYGYDPDYKSENSDYDPARARALLDLYGYVDRDGDGWRDQPDGKPLLLEYATTPDSSSREFDEVWQKNLNAIGLRTTFNIAKWPEQLKRARSGQLMIWQVGQSSEAPDVQDAFEMVYGPSSGQQNLARFKLAAFDALYERMQSLPDGPERLGAVREANKLLTAYMPQRYTVHRISTDLVYPWIVGYRRPFFGNQWWQHVDIVSEPTAKP